MGLVLFFYEIEPINSIHPGARQEANAAQARARKSAEAMGDAIKTEIEELSQAELSCLKRQVEEAASRGQDLLAKIANQLDDRIEEARVRFTQVSTTGAHP